MPFADLKSARIHYDLAGPEGSPVVVFSNSLGTNLSMWAAQAYEFSRHVRVLRYDTRGHGLSSVPPGPYTLQELAQDVLALLKTRAGTEVVFRITSSRLIPRQSICDITCGRETQSGSAAE